MPFVLEKMANNGPVEAQNCNVTCEKWQTNDCEANIAFVPLGKWKKVARLRPKFASGLG